MAHYTEIVLYTLSLITISAILATSVFRSPFTSTKVTFASFGILLFFWNLVELFHKYSPFEQRYFGVFQVVASMLTLYSLVFFSLHFPYFSRRENKLNFFTLFLGGMGYVIMLHTLVVPFVEEHYPLESKFYLRINHLLSRTFTIICLLTFLLNTFSKLTVTVQRLKKFYYRVLGFFFIMSFIVIVFNYSFTKGYDILTTNISIMFIDLLFLIIFIASLSQFRFISFYPGLFSIFTHGEIPHLTIQKNALANQIGCNYLKDELWKIYEVESWNTFISEFWFSIIIDETLDNALEHGGKRADDEIIVHVFETDKYLDFYVADMGKGFDPDLIPDPSHPSRKSIPTGRGIYILKRLFKIDWNFLGNEVRVRISKNPEDNPKEY
ncbi:MAG: ATP-binding protein [Leptospiraceae bacterium]|nr:ATP-binding protein [Leptospiraceae bacterium]